MLTSKQKRHLRALAHSRKPIVTVGGKGATPALLTELDTALDHHELVKVRLQLEDRDVRKAIAARLCDESGAELIQLLGRIATLYRHNREAPRISLNGEPSD
jgi:RNA-binding protein